METLHGTAINDFLSQSGIYQYVSVIISVSFVHVIKYAQSSMFVHKHCYIYFQLNVAITCKLAC